MLVIKVGPFFAPGAQAGVDATIKRARHRLAGRAKKHVDANLRGSIKHPTPFYQLQIDVRTIGDAEIVDDNGVVYGPWLEGVSERNRSTRFKGYASFRRAYASTIRDAESLGRDLEVELVRGLS